VASGRGRSCCRAASCRWRNRFGTRYSRRRCRSTATTRGRPAWRPRWWPRGRRARRGLVARDGSGMEDGAHRDPVGGGAQGGRPLLGARRARRDVLCERGAVRILGPRRVRDAGTASGRDRAGIVAGDQGGEHELTRIHRSGRTRVDGRSDTARRRDLVERAGEGDARVVGDGALQVRGGRGGDGYGNGHPPAPPGCSRGSRGRCPPCRP